MRGGVRASLGRGRGGAILMLAAGCVNPGFRRVAGEGHRAITATPDTDTTTGLVQVDAASGTGTSRKPYTVTGA